ncbi:TIGR03619 family F420-dependent LLM class oxidoreductase [Nocardiopsis sp. HNM0947]|uniref:TIGR03619 family F420-dependent LLM class oxidoreductase n=1 Tax=Nocardiopsis coralli TaxID=2772213 RepID=A0ABR9P6S1_9ACTN|nr:TIGR03619 family F420-dependent LLM class oxidoreductase [Nocardiopsis coralli]MBE2999548.1 TIGR03619 family F420-dependent LLM class oxidoreductase [Nocardiopsis coralli]
MRIGVNLPNFGPDMGPKTLLGWGRTVEELGYDLLLVSDHLALAPDAASRSPAPFYESFTSLAWLAARTERVELGTGVVIMPHRHPLDLARTAATLDQLSDGRLVLGVGVGWARQGYEALGVPFERRGRITDEYLRAVRRVWEQERATFSGEYAVFRDVHTGPAPARWPGPPVWVGGNSRAALRRAVRHGDAWHPLWPQVWWLHEAALPEMRRIARAEERPVPDLCPRIQVSVHSAPLPEDARRTGHGSAEQIRADLEALHALGCAYVVVDTDPGDQRLRRSAEEDWQELARVAQIVSDPF